MGDFEAKVSNFGVEIPKYPAKFVLRRNIETRSWNMLCVTDKRKRGIPNRGEENVHLSVLRMCISSLDDFIAARKQSTNARLPILTPPKASSTFDDNKKKKEKKNTPIVEIFFRVPLLRTSIAAPPRRRAALREKNYFYIAAGVFSQNGR